MALREVASSWHPVLNRFDNILAASWFATVAAVAAHCFPVPKPRNLTRARISRSAKRVKPGKGGKKLSFGRSNSGAAEFSPPNSHPRIVTPSQLNQSDSPLTWAGAHDPSFLRGFCPGILDPNLIPIDSVVLGFARPLNTASAILGPF